MKKSLFRFASLLLIASTFCLLSHASSNPGIKVGTFKQEISQSFSTADGLLSNNILSIAIAPDGEVYAGTDKGLCVYHNKKWRRVDDVPAKEIAALTISGDDVIAAVINQTAEIYSVSNGASKKLFDVPCTVVHALDAGDGIIRIAADKKTYQFIHPNNLSVIKNVTPARSIATRKDGYIAIGGSMMMHKPADRPSFITRNPKMGDEKSWVLKKVKGVTFDSQGRLWFASPQGVGCMDKNNSWTLYTGQDGLPYNDFTCIAPGEEGVVWFGTKIGAIRFDGENWNYRQGKRWLPNDQVNDIAVTKEGHAWIATANGVGLIERRPMTLKQKADFYEDEIEKYIKRTEYGYLSEVHLPKPGDKSKIIYSDSDNDGLWTSMYGAGECFAYAATKDPAAKIRAKKAFEALRFLCTAPIDGEVKQQPGFVARTVVPTSEPDPNKRGGYTLEGMKKRRANEDGRWKVYFPRWPLTKDKKYYYKTDTSSDELDGHFFFYALYYDLVADTQEEKERVKEVVRNLADHLVRNDFCLVDHDGTPTRWGIYSPAVLNHDFAWYAERGLNSLSMLSYLSVAEHVTGDTKYGKASRELIDKHSYHLNAMYPKMQRGVGSGNQSDDEMAFMSFYNLLKYTKDETLRNQMLFSFFNYWTLEFPEMNPFFNYAYAACGYNKTFTDPWGTYKLSPWNGWLEDSAATLKDFPLDRLNWAQQNNHRLDIVSLPQQAGTDPDKAVRQRGHRINGKVLSVAERHFNHWNTDPWTLNYGGGGTTLGNGTVYLLPYYMGLYYGYVE